MFDFLEIDTKFDTKAMPNIKRLRKELEQKARFDTKKQKLSMPRYAPKARLCYKRDKKLKPYKSRFLSQYNSKKSKNLLKSYKCVF